MKVPFADLLLIVAEGWATERGLIVERAEKNRGVLEVKKRYCPAYLTVRVRKNFSEPYEISGTHTTDSNDLRERIKSALDGKYLQAR